MFRRLLFAAIAASLATLSVAQAGDVAAPPPGYRPDPSSDEAGLWMQSDTAERNIIASPLLIHDASLDAYIKGVVCKLAASHCTDLRIYVVEEPTANAYAMPNGAIVVWTGMLLRVQNEAQLAFVLGHEMTHYFRRHTLQRYQSTRDTFNAVSFVALAGLFALPVELAAGTALMSYSRDQEREADAGGFDLATAAGYDPAEAPAIWRYMAAEDKADPDKPGGGIFGRNHPSSEERMETLSKRSAELEPTNSAWKTNVDAYRAAIAPFRSKFLAEEMGRGNARESAVLFQHMIEAEPNSSELEFYLGEAYRKRNQANDAALAAAAYQKAVLGTDAPAAAWRGLGLLAMKGGDKDSARTDFGNYLAKSPAADDRPMIEFYLTQLGT